MSSGSPALIALFAVLTAAGGFVSIPLGPAPITLQNLFTILAGAILGPVAGALSQLVYIVMGAAGLPVFSAGGSGMGHLLGPTGGYLFGFVAASYVSGFFARRDRALTGFAFAVMVIYIIGLPWLKLYTRLPWPAAFIAGAAVFLPGDIIKIAVALGIYRRLKSAGLLEELK